MRVFLSARLKSRIRQDSRTIGQLAALVNLNIAQLSTLTRDQIGIGPILRVKIIKLGTLLGVPEAECFREVPRG